MPENENVTINRADLDALIRQAQTNNTPSRLSLAGRYLTARLAEPSTYTGITLLCTAFGVHLNPDKVQIVTAMGLAVAGSIQSIFKDPGSPA